MWLLCLCLLIAAPLSQAGQAKTLFLDTKSKQYDLAPYTYVLDSPEGLVSIRDAIGPFFNRFKAPDESVANFGLNDSVFWMRVDLANPQAEALDLVLRIANPLVNESALWLHDPDHPSLAPQALQFGPQFPAHLTVAPESRLRLYIKVRTDHTAIFPLFLHVGDNYVEYLFRISAEIGVLLGIMLGFLLYNLFLFLATRQAMYFYYCATGLGIALSFVSSQGFLKPWTDQYPDVNTVIFNIVPLVYMATFLQLARLFFSTHWRYPRVDVVLVVVCFYSLAISLTEFFAVPRFYVLVLYIPPMAFASLLLLLVCLDRLGEGDQSALYFLLTMLMMSASGLWSSVVMLGYINSLESLMQVIKFSCVAQLVLLSLGIASRIKGLEAARAQAQRNAGEAEMQNRAKSEFLQQMSREIRTPMTGVIGLSELLKSSSLTIDQKHYVDMIYKSGYSLLNAIDDILDYSSLEDGQLEIRETIFNLESLLADCADIFELTAAEKKLDFICSLRDDVPRFVRGDEDRIRQVLVNLLANAFKFTEHGMIHFRVSLAVESGERNLLFEVIDTGLGISAENRERLFQPYSQADSGTARQYGGSGLGLAISKSICDALGGEIGVDSEEGSGSRFWFSIALPAVAPQQVEAPVLASKKDHMHAVLHLLYLHKDPVYAAALKEQSRVWGIQCETFSQRSKLVRYVQQTEKTDCGVLCIDGSMDSADLSEVLEAYRADALGRGCQPHILGLVRFGREIDKERLQTSGIHRIATRPAAVPLVLGVINDLLDHRGRVQAAELQLDRDFGFAHREVLLLEDDPTRRMVVHAMLLKLGLQVHSCRDEQQALQLCEARNEAFDLIVIDLDAEEGIDDPAIRMFREAALAKSWPVPKILLLSTAAQQAQLSMQEQGIICVVKPVTFVSLLDALKRLLADSGQ